MSPFRRLIGATAFVALATAPLSRARAATPGERIYQRECAGCHGPRGEGGRGPALAVPKLSRAADRAALIDIIEDGIDGTEMPDTRLQERAGPPGGGLGAAAGAAARRTRAGRRRPRARALLRQGGLPALPRPGRRGGRHGRRPHRHRSPAGRGPPARARSPSRRPACRSAPRRTGTTSTSPRTSCRCGWCPGRARRCCGVRVNEDTFSIQVRDASNRVHSFWKTELRELHKEWGRSPMPSYAETLQPDELRRPGGLPGVPAGGAVTAGGCWPCCWRRLAGDQRAGRAHPQRRGRAGQLAHLLGQLPRPPPLAAGADPRRQRRPPAAGLGVPVARGRQARDLAHRHRRHPLHHREAAHRDRARRPHRPPAVELPPAARQGRAELLRRR